MELKALVPLLGVLLGWFLSQAIAKTQRDQEHRARTNRVITTLLLLRDRSIRAQKLVDVGRKMHGTDFSEWHRQHYLDTHLRPLKKEAYDELIADLSAASPRLAITIKHLIESHLALFEQKMPGVESASRKLWELNVELFNEVYSVAAKNYKDAILSLAWSLAVTEYISYKWYFYREAKNEPDWSSQIEPYKTIMEELVKDKSDTEKV